MLQQFKPRFITLCVSIFILTIITFNSSNSTPLYPPPQLPNNPNLGINLAYSMNLLSQNKREVRILFYGQSITRDHWWKEVTRELKRKFPNTDIISKNLAIGGFSAQRLILKILQVKSTNNFTFRLIGSQTGVDGIGTNLEKFISNSGRIVILPEHWWLKTPKNKPSPIKPGYELHFSSKLLGINIYKNPKFKGFNRESTVTLAQGLTNQKHTLTLVSLDNKKVPIEAIRVFKPPLIQYDLSLENITSEEWIQKNINKKIGIPSS